jgi:hypothetical protein
VLNIEYIIMKIKDLIKELSELNQELEIIVSRDAEGNGYSPMYSFYQAKYHPNNDWSGEIIDVELNSNDKEYLEYADEIKDECIDCVVFTPSN